LPASPQRESLLFALRELTGENPGPSPQDWKRLYSPLTGQRLTKPLEPGDQVLHLKDGLVEASPSRQLELLTSFKDRSGPAYDSALALAIPALTADLQKLARTVLADRLHCRPLKELREKLRDADGELRRSALKVIERRKLRPLVPDLISLLE